MDHIAKVPATERANLFLESAAILRPERSPAIIEKDFWVCWSLHRIYDVLQLSPQLMFKGGTSLSKAYAVINRFSEDVDLSLSRQDLGFTNERDPEQAGISGNERRRRIDALVEACKTVIRDRFVPEMRRDFASVIDNAGWSVELDKANPQTVIFSYPRSRLSDGLPKAIHPVVRLEMGARSDDWPAKERTIRPYAAEAYPDVFEVPSCKVRALDAQRTFWEKVTLLHAEYHRPADKSAHEGLSRHFYDVYQLALHDVGKEALEDLSLLERVVAHKQVFFRSGWAHYETAIPGAIHLVPPEKQMNSLRADYSRMREMIFGDAPAWGQIMEGLRKLEARINEESQGGS
jgi:hypothetical protein